MTSSSASYPLSGIPEGTNPPEPQGVRHAANLAPSSFMEDSRNLKAIVEIADKLIGSSDLDALLRKAVELARTRLGVERCSILLNFGTYLQGTYGTDLEGRTTYEKNIRVDIDPDWERRLHQWSNKQNQWIIDYDLARSSPDARMAQADNFWVATTPIKGADNRVIAVFCNDAVISGDSPDDARQAMIAVFCSLLGNMIERQRGLDELRQRDHVLDGVARAANQLLTIDDMDAAIREALRVLGESMDVDRVYIFKNHLHPLTGEWLHSQRYEWVRDPGLASIHDDQLQDVPYQPTFAEIFDCLSSGRVYSVRVHEMPGLLREFMEVQQITSILLVPIHMNNQFWGFVGFDDCHLPREWSYNEKTILMAMAGSLGGAISQEVTKRQLRARDRTLSGVAKANRELLTNPDPENALANSLRILASAVAVDRIYIGENEVNPSTAKHYLRPRYLFNQSMEKAEFVGDTMMPLSYADHLPGWFDVLSSGRPIQGRLLDFLVENSDQIRSVLVAPLMVENRVWGIIGFDKVDLEHQWSESEISTLSTMAGSIGAAIARQRAEKHLRSSEEHFRSLIENASDLIFEVGRRGELIYGSPSVSRELGFSPAAFATMDFLSLIHPDDQPAIRLLFDQPQQETTHPTLREFRLRDAKGEWRYVECALKYFTGTSPEGRFIVNARDITLRIRAEDALRQSEELFRHSQKMEAVGRLAGGIAHDFNNLLTAILGYGDLLMDQIPEASPWRKEIGEIHRAAERAHSLTRQLLAFSRRQIMESKAIDLNHVVTEMDRFLKRLISEDIKLVTCLDSNPCMVKVDRGQIEQVIVNLAVNARDAMPEGGELGISTKICHLSEDLIKGDVSITPGHYVLLIVSDTGHGISEDIKSHVFEPFFTTKEVGKGTGLGLAMVYGTVTQSNGYVLFESEDNRGTIFYIYLPLVDVPAGETDRPASTTVSGGTETILLLEDDEIVQQLSHRILSEKGYRVITRDNGREGLDYFIAHPREIDLVVTDIIMPQMSGLAFTRAARQLRPDLRVLFISGYPQDQQPESHEMEDGRNFIQKPFTVDALCRRIREILDSPIPAIVPTRT